MKHILPILTLALVGAAMTASAGTYYDYYENATNSPYQDVGDNKNWEGHTYDINGLTTDYGSYQVIRSNYPNNTLQHDTLYRIRITGTSVDLYLGDYVDTTGSGYNDNSLMTKGISYVGYRYLDSKNAENLLPENQVQIKPLSAEAVPFEQIDVPPTDQYSDNGYSIIRNKYYLGTFSEGDEIELYLNRNATLADGAWSYSTWYKGAYADGMETFGSVDKLMMNYHMNGDVEATRKALPLASLDPNGSRVSFAIIASDHGTVGSPLPGGNALYVIAGLFALGFIVARRRKEVAA